MRDFRKLAVWEKSHQVVLKIYRVAADFPTEEKYGLAMQMQRAASSIPTNIAEGCGHKSDPEFARYLQLAAASASELEYQLLLAKDLGYLEEDKYRDITAAVEELKKMLASFIRRVRARIAAPS